MSFITFLRHGPAVSQTHFDQLISNTDVTSRIDERNDEKILNNPAEFKKNGNQYSLCLASPSIAYPDGAIQFEISEVAKAKNSWESFRKKSADAFYASIIALSGIAACFTWKIMTHAPLLALSNGLYLVGVVASVALAIFMLIRCSQAANQRESLAHFKGKINQFRAALFEKGLEVFEKAGKQLPSAFQKRAYELLTMSEKEHLFRNQLNNLPEEKYQTILQYVLMGEREEIPVDKKAALFIRSMAEVWKMIQETHPTSVRMTELFEAAYQSPVLLFQLLTKFSQDEISKAITETPLLWPAGNSSHTVIREKVTNGMVDQFEKDLGRTHYIINGEVFPIDSPRQSKLEALKKLSSLQGEIIPYPVQIALTQSSTLSFVIFPIFASLGSYEILPPAINNTLIIEEGDPSYFWMTINETLKFRTPELNTISFELACRLRIFKTDSGEWSTEFHSMAPVRTSVEDSIDPLLINGSPVDVSEKLLEQSFKNHCENLKWDLEALRMWDNESLIPIEDIEREMHKHFETLSTRFKKIQKNADKSI